MENTKSSLISISNSAVLDVILRAEMLSDRMFSDITKPFYLIEMASLLKELTLILDDVYFRLNRAEAFESRLKSLEVRVSELLYSLSSK